MAFIFKLIEAKKENTTCAYSAFERHKEKQTNQNWAHELNACAFGWYGYRETAQRGNAYCFTFVVYYAYDAAWRGCKKPRWDGMGVPQLHSLLAYTVFVWSPVLLFTDSVSSMYVQNTRTELNWTDLNKSTQLHDSLRAGYVRQRHTTHCYALIGGSEIRKASARLVLNACIPMRPFTV